MTEPAAPADPIAELAAAVAAEASRLHGAELRSEPRLDRPPKPELGDYSSNAAMLLAQSQGRNPRELADELAQALKGRLGDQAEKVEVAGPGFVNVFLADRWLTAGLAGLLGVGERLGAGEVGERVLVEFVSANPTGPITVASGRHAAYGDALCRVLELAGDEVDREYYVNDRGGQIARFAASLRARADGEEPPEDGYQGAYVTEVARRIDGAAELDDDELARRGVELMVQSIAATLERFGVSMDRFASERANYEARAVEAAIERLDERDQLYDSDGARWLRTTAYGDDKDRVLVRSNGELTYFAADIGYHEDKRARGYGLVLDVLGADHHGYLGRIRAAWQALGGDPDGFEIVIMQLVNLLDGGQRARMSKREGAIVALDDLLDDIGVDATRWFLLARSNDTALDIDLELARERSQENPVYYVQYAHARIASILQRVGEQRVAAALAADLANSPERIHRSERALLQALFDFPGEVRLAAQRRAPHRITTYVTEVAQAFSAFYRDCKVVGAAEEGGDEDLRLAICEATRRVLARGLDLLGVSAPTEM